MNKGFNSLVVVCLLALFGCTSGLYTSKVYVDKENNGYRKAKEEVERIRREKEAAELAERHRLDRREKYLNKMVEKDLAEIRKCYADGKKYLNPFSKEYSHRRIDWLSKWSESRLPLSEAEALEGKALLSEFAEKFLPNAYDNYEKKRETLLLLQQVFNEEFSEPWTIKDSNPKWEAFNKILERFVKVHREYLVCYDELCHYWCMYRFGVLTVEDFAQIDAKPLGVRLPAESYEQIEYVFAKVNPFGENERNFAAKYAPESNAFYQKMEREFKQLDALIKEIVVARRKMDYVRECYILSIAIDKRNQLCFKMNTLSKKVMSWYSDHRIMEKTADDIAKLDNEESKKLEQFIKEKLLYIKEKALDAERNGFKVQLWEGGPYWATINIGADEPWESGYYFWWGDTVGYERVNDKWVASNSSNSNFSFSSDNVPMYNKSTLRRKGWITSDNVLMSEHDAAHIHWGGDWRMPTKDEVKALNSNCDWIRCTKNGVNGYIVRGKGTYASNSIFLPCAGFGYEAERDYFNHYGHYWSSVPGSDDDAWDDDACHLFFGRGFPRVDDANRYLGQSIRPVADFTK